MHVCSTASFVAIKPRIAALTSKQHASVVLAFLIATLFDCIRKFLIGDLQFPSRKGSYQGGKTPLSASI